MHLKVSSAKWRPFCLSLNVLRSMVQQLIWICWLKSYEIYNPEDLWLLINWLEIKYWCFGEKKNIFVIWCEGIWLICTHIPMQFSEGKYFILVLIVFGSYGPAYIYLKDWYKRFIANTMPVHAVLECNDMNTLSTLLALCEGNPPVTGGFPSQQTSNVVLWCFLPLVLTPTVEQTALLALAWNAIM